MADEPDSQKTPRSRTPRQDRIHRRLGLIGEGPQSFYSDVLQIVNGDVRLASASNTAGHLLRELESALRDALEPITQHRAVALKLTQAKNPNADHPSQPDEIGVILSVFGVSETEGIGADWLDIATGEVRPHKVAHRRQFNRPSPLDQDFVELWKRFESVLDVILEQFESRYVDLYGPIDALLAKPEPSSADLDYLGKHLPNNPVIRFHFFETLSDPGWLKPLQQRRYFRDPPPALVDESKKTTSFSPWAPPLYLQRMAALPECQQQVLEIVLDLPDSDNFYVHDGVVKVIEILPAHLSVQTVPQLVRWLGLAPPFGLLPERLGQLAVALAKAGYVVESLEMLRALLVVNQEETKSPSGKRWRSPSGRIQDYEYAQVLRKSIPQFLDLAPGATFEMLVALLDEALQAGSGNGDSLSWIWRRSIEQANRGNSYKIKDLLIDAVRDAALTLCRAQPARLRSMIAQFEGRPDSVWHRLSLFLLVQLPEATPDLVEQCLLLKDRFDAWRENPEYVLLLRSAFSLQKPEVQSAILAWIDAGPDREYLESLGPEVAVASRRRWQDRRLRVLKGGLPREWERRLETDHPSEQEEEPEDGAIWVGRESPLTPTELRSMPVAEVADYLRSWKAAPGWRQPSAEGLGTVLTSVVAENTAGFADAASQFMGLEPTYVRSFLQGFTEAIKQSKSFRWRPVLALCEWVVAQGREPEGDQRDWDRDPGWSWSRKAIAGLLRAGMDTEANAIPLEDRDLVWRIIEPLTWDPDPGPERDASREPESGFDLAINSVRGEAMIAAIRYGVWAKKRSSIEETGGFTQLPELQTCLEQHLDPAREPSIGVRAVFGESFPVLCWIDNGWAWMSAERIFATGPALLREAAWANYLKWNQAYDGVFRPLIPFYSEHVRQLTPEDGAPEYESATNGLVHHLMAFYWRGVDGVDPLIDEFLVRASAGTRNVAFDFIGQSLGGPDHPVPPEMQDRMRRLWERNVAQSAESTPLGNAALEPFGWWLKSGNFDLSWSLKQAEAVLALGATLEPDHVVVEYLEAVAKERPLEAARILAGLCDNMKDEWSIHGWIDHAMTVLATVMASGNADAVNQARAVSNRLVARGHTRFRGLL